MKCLIDKDIKYFLQYIIMNNKTYLSSFNDHFEEMIEDVKRIFPEDKDIKNVHAYLNGIMSVNTGKIHKIFRKNVIAVYRNHIINDDIDFFLNRDYSDEVSENYKDTINDKLEILKVTIRKMDKSEQNKILQYLKNLIILSDLYINSKVI